MRRCLGTTLAVILQAISVCLLEAIKSKTTKSVIIEVLEDSQARQLAAEMMTGAGEVAGRYGQFHNMAHRFEVSQQPELPSEEELLLKLPAAGSVRACAMRRCMPARYIMPARRAGLAQIYTPGDLADPSLQ